MKAIESIRPILAQLTREELITLASLALTLAEREADINSIFEHPNFRELMDKDLQDIESDENLIPFTLDSLRTDFDHLKNG